jgi:diguanylate cyclase (GGDEF)-like protein
MDDVRYSEFKFLRALESRSTEFQYFNYHDERQRKAIGLEQGMYVEMAAALIEDLYVRFSDSGIQTLVPRLRGELIKADLVSPPHGIEQYLWNNPREAIQNILSRQSLQGLCITYRGLRRIEELRDILKRDRILEDFGVLLSIRYFRRDCEDALRRPSDVAVSVIYADMDDFGIINKKHGQVAGDVVMKAYLEVVRNCLGSFGEGYRGVGDETCALIFGQGHARAVEIAETIRKRVGELQCNYQGIQLPKVTASIGVATTPPENRSLDIETCSQNRQLQAKKQGKNRVIAN